MTAEDPLEDAIEHAKRIRYELEAAHLSGRIIVTLGSMALDLGNCIATIEALIPSKAEREFLEAAEAWAIWCGFDDGDKRFPLASPHFIAVMDAYRALLAERTKE